MLISKMCVISSSLTESSVGLSLLRITACQALTRWAHCSKMRTIFGDCWIRKDMSPNPKRQLYLVSKINSKKSNRTNLGLFRKIHS